MPYRSGPRPDQKDLFELKNVGDGIYAAAGTTYKVNANAALILTTDGVGKRHQLFEGPWHGASRCSVGSPRGPDEIRCGLTRSIAGRAVKSSHRDEPGRFAAQYHDDPSCFVQWTDMTFDGVLQPNHNTRVPLE